VRILLLLVPVALIIGALLLSFHEEPARAPAAPTQEPPRYSVTDAHWLRLGSDGEPEFRAQAASMDYFADESVKLREVKLDALGGYSSPWHVEAPRGSAPPRERRLREDEEPAPNGEKPPADAPRKYDPPEKSAVPAAVNVADGSDVNIAIPPRNELTDEKDR